MGTPDLATIKGGFFFDFTSQRAPAGTFTAEGVMVNILVDPMAMFVLKFGMLASPLGVWHFGIVSDNGSWMVENQSL